MTDKQYQAKKWLSRNYELNREIKLLEDKLEASRQRVNNIVGRYELNEIQMQHSRGGREDLIAEVIELENLIERRLKFLMSEDNLTTEVINRLETSIERAVLIARYVNRYSWTKIERIYRYSHAQMMRIHLSALDKIIIEEDDTHEERFDCAEQLSV